MTSLGSYKIADRQSQAIFAGTPVREADSQQSMLQDRYRPGPNSPSERGVS
jgi:hypothetical protein